MSDYETCSYCTTEVLDSELIEMTDGARICTDCDEERRLSDIDHADYLDSIRD